MKLNLTETTLNTTSQIIHRRKEEFFSSPDQDDEDNKEKMKLSAVVSPTVFLSKRQTAKWNRLSDDKKNRIIQQEKRFVSKRKNLKSELFKSSNGGQKVIKEPHSKNDINWIKINATTEDKENRNQRRTIRMEIPIKSTAQQRIKTETVKGVKTATMTASGSGIAVETAKRVAEKFRQQIKIQEQQKTEYIQRCVQNTDKVQKEDSWTEPYSLGKMAGNVTATIMSPVVQAFSTLATTIVTSLMSVLLPVLCVAFLVTFLFAMITSVFGGAATPTVSGTVIVQVAEQELSEANRNIGGEKYKNWYGMDADWCAMFVSWCADQCGFIERGIMPKSASVSAFLQWYQEHDLYQDADSGYKPQTGDVIIFKEGMSHTGLVVSYDPETDRITTIEGNAGSSFTIPFHKGSRVTKNIYPRTSRLITGYGTPEYPDAVSGILLGNTNAEKIFRGCVQAGYTEEAAASIVGNLYQEAGQDSNGDLNLHATESNGEGIGMVQWSYGRKTAFLQFCESQGQPWPDTSAEIQLNYMLYELSTNQWIWSRNSEEYGAECNIPLEEFKSCQDIDFATRVFCAKFERCHLRHANLNYRQQMAHTVYESYAS